MKYTKETQKSQIIEDIKKYNPELKDSSIKQYVHRILFFIKNHNDIDLEKPKEILENINKAYDNLSTRKGIISPLARITQSKLLLEEIQNLTTIIRNKNEENKTTEKEKLAWMDTKEINKIINNYTKEIKKFENQPNPTSYQRKLVKKFLLFLFFSGKYIPPRRLMDYSLLLWDSDNTDNFNYIENNKIIFNKYKTASTYGQQVINLPKQLMKYIDLHRKLNYDDSKSKFMFSTSQQPLSAVSINSFLSEIAGKTINSNIFRKVYITDLFKSRKSLKVIKQKTSMMGTSANAAIENYNKIDVDNLIDPDALD